MALMTEQETKQLAELTAKAKADAAEKEAARKKENREWRANAAAEWDNKPDKERIRRGRKKSPERVAQLEALAMAEAAAREASDDVARGLLAACDGKKDEEMVATVDELCSEMDAMQLDGLIANLTLQRKRSEKRVSIAVQSHRTRLGKVALLERAVGPLADMSDAERASLAQVLVANGIPSKEASGTPSAKG